MDVKRVKVETCEYTSQTINLRNYLISFPKVKNLVEKTNSTTYRRGNIVKRLI